MRHSLYAYGRKPQFMVKRTSFNYFCLCFHKDSELTNEQGPVIRIDSFCEA
ncbi:hypothetical protein RO3G_12711 [Rhizopus delemar RA 99-880]|uniref:Uncharacterized protein n=1 Tax=Rhizopus delemar (strain RA 99-880 / ATCC MYA-4621 / FGSC 9543 / NRRL 43880) TaxID=246409 RepID=I1CHS0_RHIO9|nr:hypothetical protein RO3G_12711 [Rhizopus delemar RA 99-880]|eukprot:EIE88000.1 hypothetical protein RO3G_12711 [Rhizopus delemar RA 99-880]